MGGHKVTLTEGGKANTHLTHLEELVLTQGSEGYEMARAFLLELLETLKGNSILEYRHPLSGMARPLYLPGSIQKIVNFLLALNPFSIRFRK